MTPGRILAWFAWAVVLVAAMACAAGLFVASAGSHG